MAKKRLVLALGHDALGTNLPEQKTAVTKTAKAIADKIAVMYRGQVVRYGSKTDVLTPPFDDYIDLLLSSVPEMQLGWLEQVLHSRKMESGGN